MGNWLENNPRSVAQVLVCQAPIKNSPQPFLLIQGTFRSIKVRRKFFKFFIYSFFFSRQGSAADILFESWCHRKLPPQLTAQAACWLFN